MITLESEAEGTEEDIKDAEVGSGSEGTEDAESETNLFDYLLSSMKDNFLCRIVIIPGIR